MKMREFFVQSILLLVGALIGIVAQLLDKSPLVKKLALLLAVVLIVVSLIWIGYEIAFIEIKKDLVAVNISASPTNVTLTATETAKTDTLSPSATPEPSVTPELIFTQEPSTTSTITDTPTEVTTVALGVKSTFDESSLEGWTAYRTKFENKGAGGSGGGENNGCLIVTDDKNNTGYFVAPQRFLGDWRVYSKIRVDLWSSGGDYYTSGWGMYGDIYIKSGAATAQRLFTHRPGERWETLEIPLLDDDEWIFSGGATKLSDVLVYVTDFQIRAEYGTGSDACGLDNVELVP